MSVSGGGSGWTRFGSVAGLFVLASLVGTAACGGRTSMLDPDAYLVDGQGGSSGVKPGGSAGKTTTGGGLLGNAGASSSPTTPSSGVDTSLAKTPCERYCAGYGSQCKQRLDGKDCLATCQVELNGSGAICQLLGIDTLDCLTPFFGDKDEPCGSAVGSALTQCKGWISAFDQCKSEFASGKPNPVGACPRSGDVGTGAGCISIFECDKGPYVTFCSPTESMHLVECNCAPPAGNPTTLRLPLSKDTCLDAAALCR